MPRISTQTADAIRARLPGAATAAAGTLSPVPALLLALHALLAWLGRAPGILTRQDDSRYLLLARALRHGQYRDLMWPGAPLHHMYPPGYPLLLAAWTTLGGERFGWLVLLQIVLSVGAIALAYDATRRATTPSLALCALAVLAVNPELLAWAGQVASEPALAFCFAAAVWGAIAIPAGARQVAVVLAAALAAPLMRTAGTVLPLAVAVAWLLERRYRDALLAAALSALVVVPLLVWTMNDPTPIPGSSYAGDLTGAYAGARVGLGRLLEHRVVASAVFYPAQALPWLLPLPTVAGTIVDNVVDTALVVAGCAAGLAAGLHRHRLGALTLLASAALLLVWPYQVARYVTPLLPLVVPTFLVGVTILAAPLGARARAASLAAATAIVLATAVVRTGAHVARYAGCDRRERLPDARCVSADQASFFRAVQFVNDSLPRTARVLSAKSEPLHLYTAHPTAPLAMLAGLDSAAFWTAVRDLRIDYVLLGALNESERPRLARRLAEQCDAIELVRAFPPRTYLFRIAPRGHGDTTSPSDPTGCAALREYERETVPIVGARERATTTAPPLARRSRDGRRQSAADTSTRLS